MKLSVKTGMRLIWLLTALSAPAAAHTGIAMADGFSDGFIHPWLGVDHLLVIFSVGLWGGGSARAGNFHLPAIFVVAMSTGAGIHFAGFTLMGAEQGVALSAVVLGVMLLQNRRLPFTWSSALVAAFAVCHGYVHGAEIGPAADPLSYTQGFLLSTVILLCFGALTGALGNQYLKFLRSSTGVICSITGLALLAGF